MTTNDSGATPAAPITTIKIVNVKSPLVAFLLTLFLGPLGMFYSTIIGGIVMTVVYLVLFVSVFTLGFGLMLFSPAWIACIAWGMIAASNRPRIVASV